MFVYIHINIYANKYIYNIYMYIYMIVIKRKAPKNMILGTLCYAMDNEV